jgi:hypothetical protein
MKKLLLSVTLMTFAVAVQAGDAKDSKVTTQDKPACCAKAKDTAEATSTCPFAKSACCQDKQAAAKDTAVKQQALLSPKAASEVRR